MAKRPEDILPDEQNEVILGGVTIRKGSFAAILHNAAIIADTHATQQDKAQALAILKELAPVVHGSGMLQHVTFKNPEIQKLFNEK